MKRYCWYLILFFLILINCNNIKANNDFSVTGNTGVATISGFIPENGCWGNTYDIGLRLTLVDGNGNILSGTNSVDYFSTESSVANRARVNIAVSGASGYNIEYPKKYKKGVKTVGLTKRVSFNPVSNIVSNNLSPFPQSSVKSLLTKSLYDIFLVDSNANTKYSG